MKKILTLFISMFMLLCFATGLVACGSCQHPTESLRYSGGTSDGKTYGHGIQCNKCGNFLGVEPCVTVDGKCGVCTICGFEEHCDGDVIQNDKFTDTTHTLKCNKCGDEIQEAHELSVMMKTVGITYHSLPDYHCLYCGYKTSLLGDHYTTSNEWNTNATSHWKICDEEKCATEFNYGIHDLADGACSVCGYKADSLPVSENLAFTLSEDESYYILSEILTKPDEKAVIIVPSTYEGKPVKVIGNIGNSQYKDSLVHGSEQVKALYIPDGVTTISDYAFGNNRYMRGLVYLRLPEGIEYIGTNAFQCADLYELKIPSTVNGKICDGAFSLNLELRTLIIGEGFTQIGDESFKDCSMLTDVTLPSTVTKIGTSAFQNCDNIQSMTLLKWNELTEKYDSGNSWYSVVDNCLIERDGMKLIRSNANMDIPSNVKVLGTYSLSGDGIFYESVNEAKSYDILLPQSLTTIETGALSFNSSIKTLSIESRNTVYAVESNCLYEKATSTLLYGNASSVIPECVTSIAKNAFVDCSFGAFTIPANVKNIESGAFSKCSFAELTISDGVEDLGFQDCKTEQSTLTVPGSVKKVSGLGISGMEKIVLNEGVEKLEDIITETQIVLPTTLKSVNQRYSQYASDQITVYENCKYFGDASNPYLILIGSAGGDLDAGLTVHADTRAIADHAFEWKRIGGIQFGNKLEYIGEGAFTYAQCGGGVVIPDSVKEIGEGAFYGCSIKLVLGSGLIDIGERITNYPSNYNEYGNCYYIGSVDNPYMVLVMFKSYVDGEFIQEWTIHSDTKFIIPETMYWSDSSRLIYDGTAEQWNRVKKGDSFVTKVNSLSEFTGFTCSDTVVDLYGGTYGLAYKESSNYPGTYSVSVGTATGDIVIPSLYKGLPVSEISSYGFANKSSVASVKLPDGLIEIGKSAFSGSAIKSIAIPGSVEIIGESAFEACESLTNVTLGNGIKRIESGAFRGTPITSLVLPESMEYFSDLAISGCDALSLNEFDNAYYLASENNPYFALVRIKDKASASCTVHNDTVMILGHAFEESSITSIVIPDNVRFVGERAFNRCYSLTSATIGKGITVLDEGQFLSCTSLTTVEFRGEIINIGFQSFMGCTNLKSITIPESVEIIDATAFSKSNVDYSVVITYGGTVDEWKELINTAFDGGDYFTDWSLSKVVCSDGEILRNV